MGRQNGLVDVKLTGKLCFMLVRLTARIRTLRRRVNMERRKQQELQEDLDYVNDEVQRLKTQLHDRDAQVRLLEEDGKVKDLVIENCVAENTRNLERMKTEAAVEAARRKGAETGTLTHGSHNTRPGYFHQ